MSSQRKKQNQPQAKERKILIEKGPNGVTVTMKNTTSANRYQPVTKSELKQARVIAA